MESDTVSVEHGKTAWDGGDCYNGQKTEMIGFIGCQFH